MNAHEPFIDPEDIPRMSKGMMEAYLAQVGHSHLLDLHEKVKDLLNLHTLLHILGCENTQRHQECVTELAEAQAAGERGFKAIWN